MNSPTIGLLGLGAASLFIVIDAALSMMLKLGVARSLLVAACRSVIQLLLVGLILKTVFASRRLRSRSGAPRTSAIACGSIG